MIYCNLQGGLGNMMFQIAATYALSKEKNTKCSFPNLDNHLKYLNLDKTYNPKLNYSQEYNTFFSKLSKKSPLYNLPVINYPFEYCDMKLPRDNFFVSGFFQSEKYFYKYRTDIIKLFEIDESVKKSLRVKYSFIDNVKSTSIHVRRGDYVNLSNFHPTLSVEYYYKAIEEFRDCTDMFIIFSDDIDWCKNTFTGDNFFFVENEKDYLEIILMSMCNNNIIANSSFSWWGAWLNDNTSKRIIGPNIWFGPSITHNTDDIIPHSWMKL